MCVYVCGEQTRQRQDRAEIPQKTLPLLVAMIGHVVRSGDTPAVSDMACSRVMFSWPLQCRGGRLHEQAAWRADVWKMRGTHDGFKQE